MNFVRSCFEWGFYPFVIVSNIAIVWVLQRAGVPGSVIGAALPFAYGALIIGLERWMPDYAPWVTSWRTHVNDLLHGIFSNTLPSAIGRAVVLTVVSGISVRVEQAFGTGIWPDSWPYLAQLVLAVVCADFVFYWGHRLMHTIPAILRWHAIHHSFEHMYSLASLTNHPGQVIVHYTLEFAFLVALGVPQEILVGQAVYKAVHGIVQHSNLPMKFGWLNLFLSTPEMHRWHHHKAIRESNSNYGNTTAVWDHLFGSRNHEWNRPMPRDVGLPPGMQIEPKFLEQMAVPFTWNRRFPQAPTGWIPVYPTTKRGFLRAEQRLAQGHAAP